MQNFFARVDIDLPPNLTLVFSSLFLNKKTRLDCLSLPTPIFRGQYKTFTVYTKKFLIEHPEVRINCGARCCNKCRLCYLKNNISEVSEILKSDRDGMEKYLAMKDPEKSKEIIERVKNLTLFLCGIIRIFFSVFFYNRSLVSIYYSGTKEEWEAII